MKTRHDNDVTDRTSVVYVEKKLSYGDLLDRVRSVTKIRQNNDMIDHIGAVHSQNDTELSSQIKPGIVCDKN